MVDRVVRVLNVFFWVAAVLLVASLNLLEVLVVASVLMVAVLVCSGTLAWYGSRPDPMADTEGEDLTGRQLFRALVYTITLLFVACDYITVVI